MKKVLLDTSVIIESLRLKNTSETTPIHKLIEKELQLYLSIISYFEAYAGKSIWEKPEAKQALEKLLIGMEIIGVDTLIAEMAGELRAHYNLSAMDALIAATALYHDLPLMTINPKDFKQVPEIKLMDLF